MESLESSRLQFRRFTMDDAPAMFEYAQNPLVGPNAGWPPHQTLEETKRIISMFMESDEVYAIVLKENNQLIGSIGIHRKTPDPKLKDLNQREIGYVLNPTYWGKGYVPEAVEFFKDYGFNTLNLDLIWCGHYDFNERSKRVNEKCGFNYQFTENIKLPLLNNKEVTLLMYNISNEEYTK